MEKALCVSRNHFEILFLEKLMRMDLCLDTVNGATVYGGCGETEKRNNQGLKYQGETF